MLLRKGTVSFLMVFFFAAGEAGGCGELMQWLCSPKQNWRGHC